MTNTFCKKCNRAYTAPATTFNTNEQGIDVALLVVKKMKEQEWCWFCAAGIVVGPKEKEK